MVEEELIQIFGTIDPQTFLAAGKQHRTEGPLKLRR
jgi:hypothetical protein